MTALRVCVKRPRQRSIPKVVPATNVNDYQRYQELSERIRGTSDTDWHRDQILPIATFLFGQTDIYVATYIGSGLYGNYIYHTKPTFGVYIMYHMVLRIQAVLISS